MDGSSPILIVEKPDLTALLALDRTSKRVYWANPVAIESVDYDGGNRRAVLPLSAYIPTDLKVLGRRLFWLKPVFNNRARNQLWSCELDDKNGACGTPSQMLPNDEEISKIKAYDFEEMRSILASRTNPCEKNNGDCQQLCLLSNNTRGYSCACELGHQLNEDLKSCRSATEQYLLVAQEQFFRAKITDRLGIDASDVSSFTDAILPVPMTIKSLRDSKVIHFECDTRENRVYFSDDVVVYQRGLVEPSSQEAIDTTIISTFETYLAIDWVSKLIYFSRSSHSEWRRENHIRVYSYDYLRTYKHLAGFKSAYSLKNIVVHPNLGYVFFILADTANKTSRMFRMNSDGTDMVYFLENRRVQGVGLAIDFIEDRLYWFGPSGTTLESVDIDGSLDSFRSLDVSMVTNPKTVTLDRRWAYVSNWTGVWRLDKATGAAATQLKEINPGGREMVAGAVVYGVETQPLLDGHPCAVNNGGCRRLCFAVPTNETAVGLKRQCGCFKDEELQVDGKTCV